MKLPNFTKGFTLIEIVIVMAVIGILSVLALVGVGRLQASARDVQRQQMMTGVQSALERYFAEVKTYPKFNDQVTVTGSGICTTMRVNNNNAFNTMMAQLNARGYLSAGEFDDPSKGPVFATSYNANCVEMGYGTGWSTGTWAAGADPCGWNIGNTAYIAQVSGSSVRYGYTTPSNGQSYSLCLVKEDGSAIEFKSPN